ncbi:MAG: M48 family metallopeptidase [Patescibacteria group bacterium]|nr:M48 family metallopeptidase [Patescibacteria group bacterium]
MEKKSKIATGIICTIRKHARTKKITLSVKDGNRVLVTIPKWVSYKAGKKFANKHKVWIKKKLAEARKITKKSILEKGTIEDYKRSKEKARKLVTMKLEKFNKYYKFKIGRIAIRNQRTRWGSCSEKKNLNFNWRIVLLNDEQVNYLIVHELCHLGQMNHSKKYWELVGETIPNYREIAKQLRIM